MQSSAEKSDEVIDLDSYRSRKSVDHKLKLPPSREETEDLLNEIAHHLLMAVRVITSHCH
jgi:hypothetical protein